MQRDSLSLVELHKSNTCSAAVRLILKEKPKKQNDYISIFFIQASYHLVILWLIFVPRNVMKMQRTTSKQHD